MQVTLKQINK